MTISGGIASYPEDGESLDDLVDRADRALYQSKMRGRNRIILFHTERRQSIRFPVRPRTRVRIVSADKKERWTGVQGLNLSTHGALLELPAGEPPRGRVRVTVERRGTAGRSERLDLPGRVIRTEARGEGERIRIGVLFDEPLAQELLLSHVMASRVTRCGRGGGS